MPTTSVSAGELLGDPEVTARAELLCGAGGDQPVRSVALIEDLDEIAPGHQGAVLVLTRAASAAVATYRFDVGLRRAAEHGVVGLVLGDPDAPEPMDTARAIAARCGIVLGRLTRKASIADLLAALERARAAGVPAALARAAAAVAEIEEYEAAGLDVDELVATVRAVTGLDVDQASPRPDEHAVELTVDGVSHGWLRAPQAHDPTDVITGLLLHRLASSIARRLADRQRSEDAPVHSRADLLGELLLHAPDEAAGLLHRARRLGLTIDGWHVVARIDLANLEALASGDEVRHHELGRRLVRAATDALDAAGGTWHHATIRGALLLVRMYRQDPGASGARDVAAAVTGVLTRLRAALPRLELVCGVGSPHSGAEGLRVSAAEARAAAAAGWAQRTDAPVVYDAVGFRRLLLQWHASEDARAAVRELLAPLDRLEARKGADLLRTLQAFLDAQGSVSAAAAALHLHRNTVAHRLQRIVDLLDVDLDDPEQRLALHLACRARALG